MEKWNPDPSYRRAIGAAWSFYQSGNLDRAEAFLRRALKMAPEWWEAHTRLALLGVARHADEATMPGGAKRLFKPALASARRRITPAAMRRRSWPTAEP